MPDITITKANPKDRKAISEICYRTGYMGEDLSCRGIFEDRILFGYLFCDYYSIYESEHCFVAVDKSKGCRIVGYVIGTDDSARQLKNYILRFSWRVLLRMIFHTSWKHPESFRAVLFMAVHGLNHKGEGIALDEFPAHLHINLLPEYQGLGVGSQLINTFEKHIAAAGVNGVHLTTSNKNFKAVPFYERKGYKLAYTSDSKVWKSVEDYKSMIFVKKLG